MWRPLLRKLLETFPRAHTCIAPLDRRRVESLPKIQHMICLPLDKSYLKQAPKCPKAVVVIFYLQYAARDSTYVYTTKQ